MKILLSPEDIPMWLPWSRLQEIPPHDRYHLETHFELEPHEWYVKLKPKNVLQLIKEKRPTFEDRKISYVWERSFLCPFCLTLFVHVTYTDLPGAQRYHFYIRRESRELFVKQKEIESSYSDRVVPYIEGIQG